MRNKGVLAVAVLVLVGAGGWWYITSKADKASAKVQYLPAMVRKGDIRTTISGTGPMASSNGVDLKSAQSGTVTQLFVQNGDRVKAGQLLMILENPSLESSLKQAQIELENSLTNLANLLNPQESAVQTQRLKVETAQLTLQQRQQDRTNLAVKAPIGGVIAAVKSTEGVSVTPSTPLFVIYDEETPTFTFTVSQQASAAIKPGQRATVTLPGFSVLEGSVQLNGRSATPASGNRDAAVPISLSLPPTPGLRAGMVGQVSMAVPGLTYVITGNGSVDNDAVEVRAQVAGTAGPSAVQEGERVQAGDLLLQLSNENLSLQIQQAELDWKTQEQNLRGLLDPASDRTSQLVTLSTKVEQARLTLATREREVSDLQVKAAVGGQVSGLSLRIGDRVSNNQALMRVADYSTMQVVISVDELDIAKVKVGQVAQLSLDALPGRNYPGRVVQVKPEGLFRNDIATFEVTVLVDRSEGLMAGMNTTVNVVVAEKLGVLWLPAQAVQVQRGKATVQVLENGIPADREIEVGMRTSQQVEIIGGLKESEQVVLTTVQPGGAAAGGAGSNGLRIPGGGGFGGGGAGFPAGGGGGFPAGGRGGGVQTPGR